MAVTLRVPAPFQKFLGGQAMVTGEGHDVQEFIENLDRRFPDLKRAIFDEKGEIVYYFHIYVNGQEIALLQGKGTPLEDGDEVLLVPAFAGGQPFLARRGPCLVIPAQAGIQRWG